MSWWIQRLKLFDWWILVSAALLMVFGLIMLWTMAHSVQGTAMDVVTGTRFSHQILYVLVALCVIVIGALMIDPRTIETASPAVFVVSTITLVSVVLFGQTIRGTRGWFVLESVNIQPVEFAKVAFILFFALLLKRWARRLAEVRALLMSGVALTIVGVLVLLQPDFGSFFVFLAVWGAMILMIGLRKSHLLMMIGLAIITGVVAWQGFKPYQRNRLKTFLYPSRDPLGRGYQLRQSIIAVGSGGLTGQGLGSGSQSQLRFLPERQTDFLFAVIAEELGFIGVVSLFVLWSVIVWRLWYWSTIVTDDYAQFVLLGTTLLFFVQSTMVIGMNMGLLPITGLSLPLVSYGGSSMIATALLLMVVQSIVIQSRRSGWEGKYF